MPISLQILGENMINSNNNSLTNVGDVISQYVLNPAFRKKLVTEPELALECSSLTDGQKQTVFKQIQHIDIPIPESPTQNW